MPSLHSAYPALVLYFSIKNKLGFISLIFLVITIGIWIAAVYTNHHYILDVIAGIIIAACGIWVFEKGIMSIGYLRNKVNRLVAQVS